MNFFEVEFKYRADEISLTDFHAFCKAKNPKKYIEASGFDHFYSNPKETESFCRLRVGADMLQLTCKQKTTEKNNFTRAEDNINLKKGTSKAQVESFLSKVGYTYNTSIFKSCFIYKFESYTYVYYVCYDVDMKELGRFVEIEMCEECGWSSEQAALNELVILEKLSKDLGITPQARVKRSLYEMFKK